MNRPAEFAASPSRSGARVPGWIVRRLAAEASQPTTRTGAAAAQTGAQRHDVELPQLPPPSARPSRCRSLQTRHRDVVCVLRSQGRADHFRFPVVSGRRRSSTPSPGLDATHVVIVPGREGGLRRERKDYEEVVDAQARAQRIDNILLPGLSVLPSCTGLDRTPPRAGCRLHPRAAFATPHLSGRLRGGPSGLCRSRSV